MAHPPQQSHVFHSILATDAAIRSLILTRAVAAKSKFNATPGHSAVPTHESAETVYGTVQRGPIGFGDESVRIRERAYLIQYDRELRRVATGDTVIVFMDESYLHQSHCANRSYYDPKSLFGRKIAVGGEGKQLVATRTATSGYLHSPAAPVPVMGAHHDCGIGV